MESAAAAAVDEAALAATLVGLDVVAGCKDDELLLMDGNFRWHVVVHSPDALLTSFCGSGREESQSYLVGCNDVY